MIKKFSKNVENKRFLKLISVSVILLFTFFTIVAAGFLKNLKTHYSFKQFQPKNHPLISQDEKIREIFHVSMAPYSVVIQSSSERNWLKEENLEKLLEIEEQIYSSNPRIKRIVNLANVSTAIADGDIFSTGALIELQQYKKDPNWIEKDKLISPHFISQDKHSTAFYIVPEEVSVEEHAQLIGSVKEISQKQFADSKIFIGGAPVIRTQMTELLGSEINLFVSLSLLMALIVLIAVFKDLVAVVMSGTIIVMANLFALGVMSYFEIPFTVLSTTLPILVTISVVAITTHTYVRLDEEMDGRRDFHFRWQVIKRIYKELVKPHALTALTTAVGFGSLMFSEVPLIRQYGITVSVGVLLSCFVSLSLLPSMLILFKTPRTRDWFKKPHLVSGWIIQYRKPIVLGFFGVIAVLTTLGTKLSWTAKLFTDLPASHESRISTDLTSEKFGGAVPFDVSFKAEDEKFWKEPLNIKKLDSLVSQWRKEGGVGSVVSLNTFVKASQPDYTIPDKANALSEIYLLYGMGEVNPLRDYMNPKGNQIRAALRLKDLPANETLSLKAKLLDQAKSIFPNLELATAGMASTVHELGQEVSKDLMFGFYTALLWIFILLSFAFRSIKWALVSIVPNLVPPSLLIGGLVITQTPIKPGIALIFAISLGIAFDNTVYILGRLKELLAENKMSEDFQDVLQKLVETESKPCLVSSLSLMAGFSIFLFSYFEVNTLFGAFMILALAAGLLGDLVLLPAVLSYLPRVLLPTQNSEILGVESFEKRGFAMNKYSWMVALILPIMFFSQNVEAKKHSAKEILQKVEARTSPPFEQSEMNMTIMEPDGSKKERSLVLKRMNKKGQKAIVKISSPADLKGVGFLSIQSGEKEEQWLYLPSAKRSRRIVGSSGNSRFLDSDLNYEDFKASTYKNFKNKVLKEKSDDKVVVIESKAKKRGASTYGKILTWISLKDYRVIKSSYFDKRNKLIKTMTFKKYKKYGKKYWRAHLVEVEDVKLKRKTLLSLKGVKLKRLKDDEFTLSELED